MNKKIVSMLVALFMALSALSAVSGDGSDPLDPSDGGADWDGDGLTNAEEQSQGTNMNNADSDGDGLPDGWEVNNGLSPTNGGDANGDPDGDGLTNAQEYAQGTNPNNADTDGDGKNDSVDQYPTDPNDGEYSDSDGDGIPDAYDPDFQESNAGSGDGCTEGGGGSEDNGQGQEGSFNALSPVQKTSKTSASFVTPVAESQKILGNDENFHVICCEPVWKERTAGSLSIDKNWR